MEKLMKRVKRRSYTRLNIATVASLSGFHENTVRNWIKTGILKAKFNGYKYTISRAVLKRFLKKYYVAIMLR